jgi:hypothetical protein
LGDFCWLLEDFDLPPFPPLPDFDEHGPCMRFPFFPSLLNSLSHSSEKLIVTGFTAGLLIGGLTGTLIGSLTGRRVGRIGRRVGCFCVGQRD